MLAIVLAIVSVKVVVGCRVRVHARVPLFQAVLCVAADSGWQIYGGWVPPPSWGGLWGSLPLIFALAGVGRKDSGLWTT